jgi:hypothetical protein
MSEPQFSAILRSFAEYLKWDLSGIESEAATFEIESPNGYVLTLYVSLLEEGLVEFDIPSVAAFTNAQDVSGTAAIRLLKRNVQVPVGAWVLEEGASEWFFALMWTTDLETLDTMAEDAFEADINTMIDEVDEFNGIWEAGAA